MEFHGIPRHPTASHGPGGKFQCRGGRTWRKSCFKQTPLPISRMFTRDSFEVNLIDYFDWSRNGMVLKIILSIQMVDGMSLQISRNLLSIEKLCIFWDIRLYKKPTAINMAIKHSLSKGNNSVTVQLLSCSLNPSALLAAIMKEFQSCKKSHKPHLALDPDSVRWGKNSSLYSPVFTVWKCQECDHA